MTASEDTERTADRAPGPTGPLVATAPLLGGDTPEIQQQAGVVRQSPQHNHHHHLRADPPHQCRITPTTEGSRGAAPRHAPQENRSPIASPDLAPEPAHPPPTGHERLPESHEPQRGPGAQPRQNPGGNPSTEGVQGAPGPPGRGGGGGAPPKKAEEQKHKGDKGMGRPAGVAPRGLDPRKTSRISKGSCSP